MAAKFDAAVWLKKNHFWVVMAIMLCGVLAVWWFSTSRLRREKEQRVQTIESKEKLISEVARQTLHPNQFTMTRMEEVNLRLADDVYDAWQQQYEKQRALLTWPALLGADVIATLQKLQPIEAKVRFDPNNQKEELDATARQRYRDFIDVELPKLADIIGARWGAAATVAPTAATSPKPVTVYWDPSDQTRLQRTRFYWGNRWPTTLEVLYAQEDYWVLRSIMEIIKATNGDVEYRYQAAVKTIAFIDLGRDVVGVSGSFAGTLGTGGMLGSGGGEADAAGGFVGGFPASSMGGMSGLMAGAGGGATSIGSGEIASGGSRGPVAAGPLTDPGDNRYVDLKFQPLTAQRIRAAFESRNPDDAFLMVAKRMPVRMRVKVDQRKLPKLLAECGNARMQLEVKQVRINRPPMRGSRQSGGATGSFLGGTGSTPPPPGEPTSMGAGAGAAAGVSLPPGGTAAFGGAEGESDAAGAVGFGAAGSVGFFGSTPPAGTIGPGSTAGRTAAISDESPFDVDVEIYGIVYIYNPVDREKLGIKLEETQESPPDSTTPAEPPAGTTPTQAG